MLSYSECLSLVEKKIDRLTYHCDPSELYDPVRYILSIGGKRIRPCLSIMSHNLFKDDIKDAVNPALGIELFHNFTLLHDDIMDNASKRRNKATVHEKWNQNTAILSGDAMMILAYNLITHTDKNILPEVFSLFNKTALEVCEGQQYDMNFETRNDVTADEYLEMIRLKTAVLIAASLAMGAITAKATDEDIKKIYSFGINIGLAFQLQDDFLDVYADSDIFGKRIGGDILSNKKTYLLIHALNASDKVSVKELNEWLEKKTYVPEEKINAVKSIYDRLDIGNVTKELAGKYFTEGIRCLEDIKVENAQKKELREIVLKLMHRDK